MREKKQINIEIGEHIKAAREHAKTTQEALAEQIDVSPQFISNLERGIVGVSLSTLKKLCCALNTSADCLLFGTAVNNAEVLATKCRNLSEEQFHLLFQLIDQFH